MNVENENIEFKIQVTDDLYKEVIAFANTDGGIIYIGVDNNGNFIGIDNIDENYTRVTNGIRDAIVPDVTMFVKYTLQNKNIIKIAVGEGSYKPYYLKSKGLKPSGVFIRQTTSAAPASPEQIRKMIIESDGDTFEEMRSMEQKLTFENTKKAFKKYKVEFSKEKYRVLGITDTTESLYTNIALILSEQCQHTIKVAVFADDDNTEFRDSKEFSGSIFSQLDEVFSYLKLCNKMQATFKGLERIENADYPEDAIREALINAIVHRDYSFSGSIIININSKEIEFISIGGLLPELSPDDIRSGISQPRNKKLAEVFHRLHLIESYGTGIRKIYNLYHNCVVQPRIEVTSNTFKIVLPNMNAMSEVKTVNVSAKRGITKQQTAILDFITEHGEITESQIEKILNVKRTRAYTIAKQMCDDGFIDSIGKGKSKKYIVKS